MNITPENIKWLEPDQIFVYGSNTSGIHGKGAALTAKQRFGAKKGIGFGMVGQSYAIPTKGHNFVTLPLHAIEESVDHFLNFAKHHPQYRFLVTAIGCGLAGYEPKDIAPLFLRKVIPPNVSLPKSFWDCGTTPQ